MQSKPACPLCRAPVQKGDLVEPQQPAEQPEAASDSVSPASPAASAKVAALLQARQCFRAAQLPSIVDWAALLVHR